MLKARSLQKLLGKKLALKLSRSYHLGYVVDLNHPVTFNEKLIRRYLIDDDCEHFHLADKLRVKQYVSKNIGDKHNIEVLKHSTKPVKTFSDLPNKFVIKSNHSSGQIEIIKDKSAINKQELTQLQQNWLNSTYGTDTFEHWYSEIKPQILIEELLTYKNNEIREPIEFKIFCFDGRAKFLYVNVNKSVNRCRNFYDENLNMMDIHIKNKYPIFENFEIHDHDYCIDLAENLSENIPFVRVDMYFAKPDSYYIGELTFSPGAAMDRFYPQSADMKFGNSWQ